MIHLMTITGGKGASYKTIDSIICCFVVLLYARIMDSMSN